MLGEIHVAHERHTHQLGDRVTRQVVLGRPDAAADEHRVAAFEQVAQRLDDPRLVVADHAVLVGIDARRRELLADPGTVGVDDLAEQQLGTDRKNFASHIFRSEGPLGPRSLCDAIFVTRQLARPGT